MEDLKLTEAKQTIYDPSFNLFLEDYCLKRKLILHKVLEDNEHIGYVYELWSSKSCNLMSKMGKDYEYWEGQLSSFIDTMSEIAKRNNVTTIEILKAFLLFNSVRDLFMWVNVSSFRMYFEQSSKYKENETYQSNVVFR